MSPERLKGIDEVLMRRPSQGKGNLALLWQNLFAPRFFMDLFSAVGTPLRRWPKDEINDSVTVRRAWLVEAEAR
ncbi:hypothetical protein HAP54_000001910 [Bradyrhizobium sp. 2S1]|nr:hypothetical protein [Bradyrhizobium sp. 2S1]MCK7667203.1 hypothetical protein [Bradyrhizobium sp. 2S1]